MYYRIFFLLALIIVVIIIILETSQPHRPVIQSSPQAAAQMGLTQFQTILRKVATPTNLGVTTEQIPQLGLGSPLDVYTIYLNDVQAFNGSNPNIRNTGTKFYPLTVGPEVVSALWVGQTDPTHWQATTFGNPRLAKAIGVQTWLANYIIKIPALKVVLVAAQEQEEIMVTPIVDDDSFSLITGQPLPLNEVLMRMKPEALRMVTDAPN